MATLTVKPKVSDIVQYQLPEFIRNNHDKMVTFLEDYYKSMETPTIAEWSPSVEYASGDKVQYEGLFFVCSNVNGIQSEYSPLVDTTNWAEYEIKAPLDVIRRVTDNIDVDKTSQFYTDIIKSHVIPTGIKNTSAAISDAEAIKFSKELYLSKGSKTSFDILFKNFYTSHFK